MITYRKPSCSSPRSVFDVFSPTSNVGLSATPSMDQTCQISDKIKGLCSVEKSESLLHQMFLKWFSAADWAASSVSSLLPTSIFL